MPQDNEPGSAGRQRWARVRAAFGAGLTALQVGVWYPVVEVLADEAPAAGRVWIEVGGEVWSLPETQAEIREEPERSG